MHKSAEDRAAEHQSNQEEMLRPYRISAATLPALRSLVDRVARQVGVTCCRLDFVVAEQLADHRQGLAERQRTGSEGVSEIVQPNVLKRALARAVC